MATALSDPFAALLQFDLITAHQRASVERHGAFRTFAALEDPARQLLWMFEQKRISEDELDEMMTFDQPRSKREAILQSAMQQIERSNDLRNGRFLDGLLRDGIITPTQHAAALHDPSGLHNETAADMLYELILFEILSRADFAALRKRLRTTSGATDGLRRLQTVEQVQAHLDAGQAAQRREPRSMLLYTNPTRARRLGWSYLVSIALLIAAGIWLLLH